MGQVPFFDDLPRSGLDNLIKPEIEGKGIVTGKAEAQRGLALHRDRQGAEAGGVSRKSGSLKTLDR